MPFCYRDGPIATFSVKVTILSRPDLPGKTGFGSGYFEARCDAASQLLASLEGGAEPAAKRRKPVRSSW